MLRFSLASPKNLGKELLQNPKNLENPVKMQTFTTDGQKLLEEEDKSGKQGKETGATTRPPPLKVTAYLEPPEPEGG